MYPTEIYDWSNDPNDYDFDNDGYRGDDSYQGRNRTKGFFSGQHDGMNNSSEYGAPTCFQKFKIRKRLFSSLIEGTLDNYRCKTIPRKISNLIKDISQKALDFNCCIGVSTVAHNWINWWVIENKYRDWYSLTITTSGNLVFYKWSRSPGTARVWRVSFWLVSIWLRLPNWWY